MPSRFRGKLLPLFGGPGLARDGERGCQIAPPRGTSANPAPRGPTPPGVGDRCDLDPTSEESEMPRQTAAKVTTRIVRPLRSNPGDNDEFAAGTHDRQEMSGGLQGFRRKQRLPVLRKIAGEDEIERVLGERQPGRGGSTAEVEPRPFPAGAEDGFRSAVDSDDLKRHLLEELDQPSRSATGVENPRPDRDLPRIEEMAQHPPGQPGAVPHPREQRGGEGEVQRDGPSLGHNGDIGPAKSFRRAGTSRSVRRDDLPVWIREGGARILLCRCPLDRTSRRGNDSQKRPRIGCSGTVLARRSPSLDRRRGESTTRRFSGSRATFLQIRKEVATGNPLSAIGELE